MPNSIRMTNELSELIAKTAAYTGLDESEVIRCCAKGFFRNRPVIQKQISETYYKSGPVVKTYRKDLPEDKEAFRRTIALRCFEELEKPKRKPYIPPKGVKYTVVQLKEDD